MNSKRFPLTLAAWLVVCGCKTSTAVPPPQVPPRVVVDVSEIPRLGTSPASQPQFSAMYATGSSNLERMYHVRFDGMLFDVTVDREGLVSYVETTDPKFATPDGVRPGGSFAEAVALSGAEAHREPGWLCFAELPSGWNAAALVEGRRLDRCGQKVLSVFQR